MPTSWISGKNYLFYIKTKLLLSLCYNPYVCLIAIINWIRIRILRSQSVVYTEHWYTHLNRPLPCITRMYLWVLATETASMKMNDHLIKFIHFPESLHKSFFEVIFNQLVMQKSHLDLLAWIKFWITGVESNELCIDLLLIILDFKKLLISKFIVWLSLFKIKNFGQHGHKDDLVGFNAWKHYLARLYCNFIFVLHIKEGENFCSIMLVFSEPIPKLCRSLLFHYPVICSSCGTDPTFCNNAFLLHHAPRWCSTCQDIVH